MWQIKGVRRGLNVREELFTTDELIRDVKSVTLTFLFLVHCMITVKNIMCITGSKGNEKFIIKNITEEYKMGNITYVFYYLVSN